MNIVLNINIDMKSGQQGLYGDDILLGIFEIQKDDFQKISDIMVQVVQIFGNILQSRGLWRSGLSIHQIAEKGQIVEHVNGGVNIAGMCSIDDSHRNCF